MVTTSAAAGDSSDAPRRPSDAGRWVLIQAEGGLGVGTQWIDCTWDRATISETLACLLLDMEAPAGSHTVLRSTGLGDIDLPSGLDAETLAGLGRADMDNVSAYLAFRQWWAQQSGRPLSEGESVDKFERAFCGYYSDASTFAAEYLEERLPGELAWLEPFIESDRLGAALLADTHVALPGGGGGVFIFERGAAHAPALARAGIGTDLA